MWSIVNKFIKISGTKKIFFDAPPSTLKYIHLSGPKCLICHDFQ